MDIYYPTLAPVQLQGWGSHGMQGGRPTVLPKPSLECLAVPGSLPQGEKSRPKNPQESEPVAGRSVPLGSQCANQLMATRPLPARSCSWRNGGISSISSQIKGRVEILRHVQAGLKSETLGWRSPDSPVDPSELCGSRLAVPSLRGPPSSEEEQLRAPLRTAVTRQVVSCRR